MHNKKILKSIAIILFIISITLNIYLFSQLKIEKRNNANSQSDNNIKSKQTQSIPDTQLAENLITKTCTERDSNVYITECAIELLDRTAAEREWKQRKLETAKHPQINTYNLLGDLGEGQKIIGDWRKNFEKMRDLWCNTRLAFRLGSGIPLATATCQMEFELLAINDLNNLYYHTLMEDNYDSQGIPNFEPTSKDIDALIKTNATKRGCVWAGETDCE